MYAIRGERSHFHPSSQEAYRLSRSRIENFIKCKRCFWLDERFGVKRPDMPAFSLNNAVDELLKREFDIHRAEGNRHPLMEKYCIDAVPFNHPQLEMWRDSLRRGIEFLHGPTNLSVRGGVDDVWQGGDGKLIIVDYKATSTKKEIDLDDQWKGGYKRQIEIYQWLFRQNGYEVSDTAYFVYVNGKSDVKAFDGKLEFDVLLIPYKGGTLWIEPALFEIKRTLLSDDIPPASETCDFCPYREAAGKTLQRLAQQKEVSKEFKLPKKVKIHVEEKTGSLF